MSASIARAVVQPIDAFARAVLFAPLGIDDFEWARYPASGIPAASSGLRLRPRDMAKLGQLLRRGEWGGRQLVPRAWVEACLTPHIGPPDGLDFYGYHWWLGRSLARGHELDWFAGVGMGGQRIFVIPALDVVIVMTGGLYAKPKPAWPLLGH